MGPRPHVPFPAAGRLLPRARPARDIFGSTKRGLRGRWGARGRAGSLSYKIRSRQALRNKSRVPELPAPPPRTDGSWEGGGWRGAAASEPAGLLPRKARAGGQLRVSPQPVQKKYRLLGATPRSRSVSGAVGNGGRGLGGGLGGPALRLAGAGGAAGGATCASPGVLLLIPSVVGEGVPGARGAGGREQR